MFILSNNENEAVHLLHLETIEEVEALLKEMISKDDTAEYSIDEVSIFRDIEGATKEELAKVYTYYRKLKEELDLYVRTLALGLTDGVDEKITIGNISIIPTKGRVSYAYAKYIQENNLIVPDKYKTVGKSGFTLKVLNDDTPNKS